MPFGWSSRFPAHMLMNVCWSYARSASCCGREPHVRDGVVARAARDRRRGRRRTTASTRRRRPRPRTVAARRTRARARMQSACASIAAGKLGAEERRRDRRRVPRRPECAYQRASCASRLRRCADAQRRRLARGHDRIRRRDRPARACPACTCRSRPRPGSAGGSANAGGPRRSSVSSRSSALASRYVSAPRFHLVSISLRIDVWSCTTCDT